VLSNPIITPILFAAIYGSLVRVVVYRNTYGLSLLSAQSEEDAISGERCVRVIWSAEVDTNTGSRIVSLCCGSGGVSRGSNAMSLVNEILT